MQIAGVDVGKTPSDWHTIFYYRPRSEGDNVLGSVRPSVRPSVSALTAEPSILGARLCQVQQRAKRSYYQPKVFVCVSNNHVDAVDRLLIVRALVMLLNVISFASSIRYTPMIYFSYACVYLRFTWYTGFKHLLTWYLHVFTLRVTCQLYTVLKKVSWCLKTLRKSNHIPWEFKNGNIIRPEHFTGPWGSIATFVYSRIWIFSTVLTKISLRSSTYFLFRHVDMLVTSHIYTLAWKV